MHFDLVADFGVVPPFALLNSKAFSVGDGGNSWRRRETSVGVRFEIEEKDLES